MVSSDKYVCHLFRLLRVKGQGCDLWRSPLGQGSDRCCILCVVAQGCFKKGQEWMCRDLSWSRVRLRFATSFCEGSNLYGVLTDGLVLRPCLSRLVHSLFQPSAPFVLVVSCLSKCPFELRPSTPLTVYIDDIYYSYIWLFLLKTFWRSSHTRCSAKTLRIYFLWDF